MSASQQGILVKYRIPKSMKLAERMKFFVLQKQEELFNILGTFEIFFNYEPCFRMQSQKSFSLQSAFFNCVFHHSLPESEKLKLTQFLFKLKGTDPNWGTPDRK